MEPEKIDEWVASPRSHFYLLGTKEHPPGLRSLRVLWWVGEEASSSYIVYILPNTYLFRTRLCPGGYLLSLLTSFSLSQPFGKELVAMALCYHPSLCPGQPRFAPSIALSAVSWFAS